MWFQSRDNAHGNSSKIFWSSVQKEQYLKLNYLFRMKASDLEGKISTICNSSPTLQGLITTGFVNDLYKAQLQSNFLYFIKQVR